MKTSDRRTLLWVLGGGAVLALGAVVGVRLFVASGTRERMRELEVIVESHDVLKIDEVTVAVIADGGGGGTVNVTGRVANPDDRKWLGLTVTCDVLDARGMSLGAGVAAVTELGPGRAWTFTATPIDLARDEVDRAHRVRVKVDGLASTRD